MSQGAMQYTDTFKASFLKRFDADGTVWVQAIAHAALTAKTPYKVIVNEYGQVTAALADEAAYFYVGVPAYSCSLGDLVWLQIGGEVADMVTPSITSVVGNSLIVDDGLIGAGGADYSGAAGEFAVATEASTGTTHDAILVPERVLSIQTP
jgi:hypothetical protein